MTRLPPLRVAPVAGAVAWLLLSLAGCATPQTAASPSALQPPVAFKSAPASTAAVPEAPGDAWWQLFGDPVLDALAERAAARNTRIDEAAARLAHARAGVQAAASQRRPQLSASAGASRQAGPLVNAAGGSGTLLTLSAGASWEADLFGRLAAAGDAAALDAEAAAATLAGTRLAVQAEVARQLMALRALDAERALLRDTIAAWRDSLQITEQRQRLGGVAEPAVARAAADLALAEAEALALQRQRAEVEHALALLVGESPSIFTLAEAAASTNLPQIPPGIPSEVLVRRADVAAAQWRLQAAQLRASAARAAWFPSLALTASGGQASPELASLLSGSVRAWGVGALLSLPLLDGGRRDAARLQAQADADLALAQHRGQVLQALQEVEDQLATLQALDGQAQAQQRAAAAAERSAVLTASRERQGLASRLDLLDSRRAALQAQRRWLQVQAAQRAATVALIRALGGGWGAAANAAAAQAPASAS